MLPISAIIIKKKKKQLNFANFYQNFGSVVTRLHKNIIHSYFMRFSKTYNSAYFEKNALFFV
ncbi:hypothetical protein CQA40_02150 [Helicobacter sp. MIT 01-3238]|nr:hypothetical protein CQA40_02150 [Helicobacter sp. MIT 01-3238]